MSITKEQLQEIKDRHEVWMKWRDRNAVPTTALIEEDIPALLKEVKRAWKYIEELEKEIHYDAR